MLLVCCRYVCYCAAVLMCCSVAVLLCWYALCDNVSTRLYTTMLFVYLVFLCCYVVVLFRYSDGALPCCCVGILLFYY